MQNMVEINMHDAPSDPLVAQKTRYIYTFIPHTSAPFPLSSPPPEIPGSATDRAY